MNMAPVHWRLALCALVASVGVAQGRPSYHSCGADAWKSGYVSCGRERRERGAVWHGSFSARVCNVQLG